MPIYLANRNEELTIQRVTGTDKIRTHLANMGFTVGAKVMVVSTVDDNVIVKIKGVSVAISHELSKRILVA